MKRKILISILSICAIVFVGIISWYLCYTGEETVSTTITSPDAEPITMKKLPLAEIKAAPTSSDAVEASDGTDPILVDAKGAVNLYKKQYPTAQVKGISFEAQDNRKSYEVAGVSSEAGHSVTIDATTGQVLSAAVKSAQEPMVESATIDLGNVINPDEATQVAIAMLGSDARLVRWELETNGYIARYHMVLTIHGDTMYVTIDANSSQVIEVTKEQ
ncbi:PepSY domain-containing protein [Veillonella sp. VA142]|uniref:PepSY domain-containing protein n=1 Tax=Veillonella sp. VA142 TaxID=741834 RepID=UPI000F8F0BF1|nr:PepSY domain-containing protein [Veillonella sp. VA142]